MSKLRSIKDENIKQLLTLYRSSLLNIKSVFYAFLNVKLIRNTLCIIPAKRQFRDFSVERIIYTLMRIKFHIHVV